MRKKILEILQKNKHNYISGTIIAQQLNISKMAVSKHITKLKNDGYQIISKPRIGYQLQANKDIYDISKLKNDLNPLQSKIIYFDTLNSTNTYLKTNEDLPDKTIVISDEQTMGKGRLKRNFYSPKNQGLYFSLLLKPNLEINKILKLTSLVAVAVNQAIVNLYQLDTKIKWVNDIYYQNLKLAGILIEANLELNTSNIESLIIGIGINVHQQKFPNELNNIATAIENHTSIYHSRQALLTSILNNIFKLLADLDNPQHMEIYRENSCVLNKKVIAFYNQKKYHGTVEKIDDQGFIHLKTATETIVLSSGEISLDLNESYNNK